MSIDYNIKCDACGKFMTIKAGASWSQSWSYCMDGSPDLHDPVHRCVICTARFGMPDTNCANPAMYQGVYKAEEALR